MDTLKCPICGKPGIPDYLKEDVCCPHCGSDLSIYKTISEVASNSEGAAGGARKFKTLAIVLPIIIALLFGVCYYISNISKQKLLKATSLELQAKQETIEQLEDSVKSLTTQLQDALAQSPVSSEQGYDEYTIVYKDCPWSIVNQFFGKRSDWSYISERIARENNLWDEHEKKWKAIYPGQKIRVYKEK